MTGKNCPLCGSARSYYEELIAECLVCHRDTFEDIGRPAIADFGAVMARARIAAGLGSPVVLRPGESLRLPIGGGGACFV